MARIAVFYNLPSGGGKRAVYEWVSRLAKKHQIDVYTLSTADHGYCDLRDDASTYHISPFTVSPLFRSPFGRLNRWQRFRDLARLEILYKDLASKIDSVGYEVVFLNTCLFTFIPLLPIFLQTPSVYYLHEHFGNLVHREYRRDYLTPNRVRAWLDRFDPLIPLYRNRLLDLQFAAVKHVDRFLANSDFTRQQFEADFHVKAPVIHYGVNTDVFHPLVGCERRKHVLSVGELSPRKGFDFLIESLALLPVENRPSLHLACNSIIPEERIYIENLAAQRGIELVILSNLNSSQLALEYNQAAVVVYSPILEPFGLVPLEAMACAAPLVALAEGGVQESVINGVTGYLTSRDPNQFSLALKRLILNASQRDVFGRNGRQHVLDHWTWGESTQAIERQLLSVRSEISSNP